MTPAATHAPPRPVPGSYGLPVIGRIVQTLEFFVFGGWEHFFERRRARYASSVFKVNLYQPTIAILDLAGIEPLFDAPDLEQDFGFSWARPPLPLVGGVVPAIFLNGAEHARWKRFQLALLQSRARDLESAVERTLGLAIRSWRDRGSFAWGEEIETMTATLMFEWMLGARPDPQDVRLVYNNIFGHLVPWLSRLIPWSTYARSLRAYERLIAAVRSAPRFAEAAALAAAEGLTDRAALAHRLLFTVGMNGYLGTQCMIKIIVGVLSAQPGLADRLRAEQGPVGADPLPLVRLLRLPLLDGALREMLRLHPPVSFVFGRATAARSIVTASGSFAVDAGDLLMGVIPFAQTDPATFADPLRFDLRRHAADTVEAGLIWPRGSHDAVPGSDDRTCPGKDIALATGKLVFAALLRCRWTLDEPVEWDTRKFSLNVAAPKGPLRTSGFSA